MDTQVIMPKFGLMMKEGTVARWHKQEGEPVQIGEVLLEVETDKSTLEVESPDTGILKSIIVREGTTVPVATIIGWIEPRSE
jgi:pyruvate/2-oxoglutarate dehydrogenase complex dihydrolipoamide acyltransferase (E2) component